MEGSDASSTGANSEVDFQQTRSVSSGSPHSSISSDSGTSDMKDPKQSQEKICVVCGDTATGTHFAAMTCEGCKGFFRRSMKKCVQFTCAFENQCSINKSNRKHCQACRLKKCLDMGMNSSLIMSDESVEKKRALIKMNRQRKAAMKLKKEQEEMEQREKKMEDSPATVIKLSPDDEALIKMMLYSHEQSYDFSYDGYESFRGNEQVASPNPRDLFRTHSTLAWFVAQNADPAVSQDALSSAEKGVKSKRKSTDTVDSSDTVETKPSHQGFNLQHDMQYGSITDIGDMFSSLHGVQDAGFMNGFMNGMGPPPTGMGRPSSGHRHNSDGSVSSSSTSPYMTPKGQSYDGFPNDFSAFSSMPCDPTGGMMGDMSGGNFSMNMFDPMANFNQYFASGGNDVRRHALFQHFCDIMTWGIQKVIEFCKCIPEFKALETVDQINLLRGGCLEMLVLRSYFAFAANEDVYKSDKFEYSPEHFKEAGASHEFIEQYMKVHARMRKMKLKVEEICLLIGLVLFSPDRPGIQDCAKVEAMQKRIAQALRAYEYTHHEPEKACVFYSELLLLLPVLRTINVLFSNTILTLKTGNEKEMHPLILEVNN